MNALVRASGLRGYQSLMLSLNADPLGLLQRHRIAPETLADDDALIPLRSVVNLLEASAAATHCPDFGLRMAQSQDISVLGPLAIAMQNSPTVADALQLASRHLYVHCPAMVFAVIKSSHLAPGSVELRLEILLPRQPVQRQVMDQCLGDMHHMLRFLARDRYSLKAVALPHAPEAPLKTYTSFFNAPVHPAQEHGGLHIGRQTLTATLQAVNESLRQIAVDYMTAHFGDPGQSVSSRVRLAIRRTLSTAQASKSAIADLMGMHQRTLQRRLEAEGSSFEEIREEVRKQSALRYLCETRVPLTQLAGLLGLSEQSALTRSCRRWFAATPSQIRKSGPSF
jgi:AraC-like DNA-binding protein